MDRLFFKYLAPLLAISIIPIIAIVLILFFFIRNNITELEQNLVYQNTESLRKEISLKNEALAKADGMFIEQEIDKIGTTLLSMEMDPEFIHLDVENINTFVENILRKEPSILEINVIDKWGDLVFQRLKSMSLGTEAHTDADIARVFSQIENKTAYISDVAFSNSTELPYVIMGQPVVDFAGNLVGGIVAKIDLSFIRNLNIVKQTKEQGLVYILSDNGMLISHPSKKEFYQNNDYSKYEYVEHMLNRKIGTVMNDDDLVSFYTNKYGWITVNEIPTEIALATINDNKRLILSFVNATLKSISYFTVLIILFGLILATFAAVFITKRIITPILNFTNATRRISEGEFSLKIEKSSNDEIGELTDSFNKMTEELKKEREELVKNSEIIKAKAKQKIDEHEERESSYTKANIHDIEKPLIRVKSYLSEFKTGNKVEQPGGIESLSDAIEDIEQIDHFLKDLFANSQISTSVKSFEEIDLLAAFKTVIAKLETDIKESNASIKCSHLPKVKAIKSSMLQLFQNLISNSIKYKGEKPLEIYVSSKEEADHWQFSVKDNGVGIDLKKTENLFQVREIKNNGHADYYFGLAICRNIVERHGGKIWVESEPGEGATFYFTIGKFG